MSADVIHAFGCQAPHGSCVSACRIVGLFPAEGFGRCSECQRLSVRAAATGRCMSCEDKAGIAAHRPGPISVIADAFNLIHGDRANTYGPWRENAGTLAARWSELLNVAVTPLQATLMMVDLKIMRLTQDPHHRDSVVDAIGYLALYGNLLDEYQGESSCRITEPKSPPVNSKPPLSSTQ